jgi:peptidoglycan/LPS O-acetylase OafA/YrhL
MMKQSISLLDEYPASDQGRSQINTSNTDLGLSLEKELTRPTRKAARWYILLEYLRLGGGCLVAVLPRYMQTGGLRRRKKKLMHTSYLDALRGYAAFVVVNRHRFDLSKTWFFQRPFIRVVHNAEGMVNIFFLISGYVLSYRLLMFMRNREMERLLEGLASSTFRRFFRLYVSAGVATFISMLLIRLDWLEFAWMGVQRKDTFFEQFWDWLQDFGSFSNPFASLEGFWFQDIFCARYLYPTWTIPLEFRGSMVLFAFCTAVCKLSTKHRIMLCWLTVALCYYWRAFYVAMFLQGMFVADVSLGRYPQRLKPGVQLPQHDSEPVTSPLKQSIVARVGYVMLLIVALFILGGPADEANPDPFPWQSLHKIVPNWDTGLEVHFWLTIGAFMLVFALESYPALQRPLTSNFSQYLGNLSFGIYVMHQLVLSSLYYNVLDPLREQYLGDSNWARTPGMLIYYLVVLWAAECFMRIDSRVVRLGRYLQSVTFVKWEE